MTISRECPAVKCRDGHPGNTSEGVKTQLVCTGNDGLLLTSNESHAYYQDHHISHCVSFVDEWNIPYGILTHILTDNETQFIRKFIDSLCPSWRTKHLTATLHHPQTNGKERRFYNTIVVRSWKYVAEHQRNRYIYVQPLTWAHTSKFNTLWI